MSPIPLPPIAETIRRRLDASRLARRHGRPLPAEVERFRAAYPALVEELAPEYRHYVTEISRPDAAVSLECSALLLHLCRERSPRGILDLGSGFSSWVVRTHAKERRQEGGEAPTIWSVDDDPVWLGHTRELLAARNLDTDRLGSWEDVRNDAPPGSVDLILADYSSPPVRCALLPELVPHVDRGAWLILDDTHKRKIREAAARLVRRHGWTYTDLDRVTRDVYGRSQWLIRR